MGLSVRIVPSSIRPDHRKTYRTACIECKGNLGRQPPPAAENGRKSGAHRGLRLETPHDFCVKISEIGPWTPTRPPVPIVDTMSLTTLSEAEALLDALQVAALESATRGGMIRIRTGAREVQYESLDALLAAIDRLSAVVGRLTGGTGGFVGVSFRRPT